MRYGESIFGAPVRSSLQVPQVPTEKFVEMSGLGAGYTTRSVAPIGWTRAAKRNDPCPPGAVRRPDGSCGRPGTAPRIPLCPPEAHYDAKYRRCVTNDIAGFGQDDEGSIPTQSIVEPTGAYLPVGPARQYSGYGEYYDQDDGQVLDQQFIVEPTQATRVLTPFGATGFAPVSRAGARQLKVPPVVFESEKTNPYNAEFNKTHEDVALTPRGILWVKRGSRFLESNGYAFLPTGMRMSGKLKGFVLIGDAGGGKGLWYRSRGGETPVFQFLSGGMHGYGDIPQVPTARYVPMEGLGGCGCKGVTGVGDSPDGIGDSATPFTSYVSGSAIGDAALGAIAGFAAAPKEEDRGMYIAGGLLAGAVAGMLGLAGIVGASLYQRSRARSY